MAEVKVEVVGLSAVVRSCLAVEVGTAAIVRGAGGRVGPRGKPRVRDRVEELFPCPEAIGPLYKPNWTESSLVHGDRES